MNVKVVGTDIVISKLKRIRSLDSVKKAITDFAPEATDTMKSNEVFIKGYSTGLTEERTTNTVRKDGLEVEIGTDTPYATYVENGTRFMDAEPFALPTYYELREEFPQRIVEGLKNDD